MPPQNRRNAQPAGSAPRADPYVIDYYRRQAQEHEASPQSTMPDAIVREREVEAFLRFLDQAAPRKGRPRLLEIGCGNGFLLSAIAARFGRRFELHGIDATPELVELARRRGIPCRIEAGDVRKTAFPDAHFDVALSERVIINIRSEDEQLQAYRELARILKPGGLLAAVEGFKPGLDNLNRARAEFKMPPIPEPEVNNWYTEERWARFLSAGFEELSERESRGLAPQNFLSSHYFMTRFVHDFIKPEGAAVRNTEFARFFSQALPPVGDYSPLRIKYLRRLGRGRRVRG